MLVAKSLRSNGISSSSARADSPFVHQKYSSVGYTKCAGRYRKISVTASLDTSAALAVTQQTVAFAAVVGGEALLTGTRVQADMKGRPEVIATLIGTGATVTAAVLVKQGESIGTVGCALGAAVSAYMLYYYAQRVRYTPYDPKDWPGEKAWPAVMALISFFELAATFQGLLDGFNLLSE